MRFCYCHQRWMHVFGRMVACPGNPHKARHGRVKRLICARCARRSESGYPAHTRCTYFSESEAHRDQSCVLAPISTSSPNNPTPPISADLLHGLEITCEAGNLLNPYQLPWLRLNEPTLALARCANIRDDISVTRASHSRLGHDRPGAK